MARFAFVDSMPYEKIGIFYLSAILKENHHQVDIFLEGLEENFIKSLKRFQPDFVGFGSFLGQETEVIKMFSRIKSALPHVKTIQGGPSTVVFPNLIYHSSVDFVLKGDCEETFPALLDCLEHGKNYSQIPGLVFKDANGNVVDQEQSLLVKNFHVFPPADRDLYMKYEPLRKLRTRPFLMSRGCPFPCTFCGTATLNRFFKAEKAGNHFRYGAGDRAIEEIKYVREKYGIDWVQFHDATFNSNDQFVKEFLKKYIAARMPRFICNIRSENVNEELVRLMKEAGCDRVTIGIQCGSERVRKHLSGRRTQRDENIVFACRLFKQYGIRVNIDLIFGWPGETIEEALKTIELARKTKADKVNSNVMIYYPDANITDFAFKEGYLKKFPDVFDIPRMWNPFGIPLLQTPDIKKLINLDKLIHLFVYYRLFSWKPIRDFLLSRPPNRLYIAVKRMPALLVSLKYDAHNTSERIKMIKNFIKCIANIKSEQSREEMEASEVKNSFHYPPPKKITDVGNLVTSLK